MTDCQSVSVLVSGTHLRPSTKFSPHFFNYFRHLRICWCGTTSLTRGSVFSFQLLLGTASTVCLWSESHGTQGQILLSQFWDFPNLEGQVPECISPRNRVVHLPRLWVLIPFKSKSHYDRQSVGQSVLVSGAHLGPATNFSFSLRFSFRQLRLVIL
jgi:hypothetical protein